MKTKHCSICDKTKSINEFGKDKRKPDGHKYLCKSCHNHRNSKHRAANKEKYRKVNLAYARSERGRFIQRANNLRRKFWPHLTNEEALAEYDRLLVKQNHCCAICGKHASMMHKNFDIDHCHETNKVRGLLCHKCNYNIVRSFSYEIAKKLADYLDPNRK